MYNYSRIISAFMLITFLLSGIESYCFQTMQVEEATECSMLAFEQNDIDHSVEATINETVAVAGTHFSVNGTERFKLSTPNVLSFIETTTTSLSIITYQQTVSSIYFSNLLFLIFSHFTI